MRSDKWLRFVMLMVCFLPAVNIGLIMVQKDPSAVWQEVTGVNVFVGKNREVVKQAYEFLEIVRRREEFTNVYSFLGGLQSMIFENVGWYEKFVKPDYSTFITRKPIDWVSRTVTRLDHVLSSDYIFFDPVKDDSQIQSAMRLGHIQNFGEESLVFRSWLAQLTEKDGIKVFSDKAVRLLEIIDRTQFERQIDRFISERSWRSEFMAANPRHSWWSASEVALYVDKEPIASDIWFGDLYKLHVMALSRSDKEIKIEFWWEELQPEGYNRQRHMFFHFIDSEGKVRAQQHVPLGEYAPIYPDHRWRYGAIKFDPTIDSNITALAFGVWYPDSKLLLRADKGVRDWGDRRVVVPINTGIENN